MGEVEYKRAYYWSKERGGYAPFDQKLGLDGGNLSPWLKEGVTLLGAGIPFAKAEKVFEEITAERVSHETIQEVSQKAGEEIEKEEKEKAQEAWEVFEGPSCADVEYGREEESKGGDGWKKYHQERVGDPPRRLFIQVDGGRLQTREEGWKEAKVALFFTEEDVAQISKDRRELIRKEYVATLEGIDQFEKLVWLGGLRWGALSAGEVILIGDGSSWIWERIASLFVDCTQILDWAHAVEHLWDVGKILYGEGTSRTERWVKQKESLLWEGKVEDVIDSLEKLKRKQRNPQRRKALQDLIRYYTNNKDRMNYALYREKGLPVGSGGIESGIKNVVNLRMKGCGMRWNKERAEAMLFLRARYLSEIPSGEVKSAA